MNRSTTKSEQSVTRRRLVGAIGVGALTLPLAALAQPRVKIPLVGLIHPAAASPEGSVRVALREGLRKIGYVEGKTILLDYRHAGGKPETIPGHVADLVRLKADVLVAVSLSCISAAKLAAGPIPIVATDLQIDPVVNGLAASLAKPGGNITGLFLDFPSMMGKWLELLRETLPGIKRVAVLRDTTTGQDQLDALAAAAKTLSIELVVARFQHAGEAENALTAVLVRRPQALVQLSSPIVNMLSASLAKFALANRLPSIPMFTAFRDEGGLMSFGPDLPVFWQRLAPLVDKLLKGERAGNIPIERPTTFETVVNLKTARALNIKVPPTVLVRATRVIQ